MQVSSNATQWEFNLLNYSVSNTYSAWVGHNAICTPVGNGWVRCVLYGQAPSIGGTSVRSILQLSNGSSNTYQGDGTSGVYLWGAQLEESPYPTSYIPTTGSTVTRAADVSSSASVTRAADVASITGTNFSSWYNNTEGTFFTDMAYGFTQNAGSPLRFGGVIYDTVTGGVRTLANTPTLLGGLSNSQTVPSKTDVPLKSQAFRV